MSQINSNIEIRVLATGEYELIQQIADWYYDEWLTPIDETVQRLSNQSDDTTLFQLVLFQNNKIVATGGISYEVNIQNVYPRLKAIGPWLALFYTDPNYRGQGLGKILLQEIDAYAKTKQLTKLYLYTFTAENLYERCGWNTVEKVLYKGHHSVIMEKNLTTTA